MNDATVLWNVAAGVGRITLNRPHAANALNLATARAFSAVVANITRAGADVGAVLISAVGKQFCAGGDIHEFVASRDALDALIRAELDILNPALHTLANLPMPVISAVQGSVGGAGIAIALCADIVLASHLMKLRGGYSAIGLSPDIGASYFLARRAGPARAKYLLMTNRVLDAHDCLNWGLIDELHAPDALEPASQALAAELARGARGSLHSIKRLCDGASSHDLNAHQQWERQALLRRAVSSDAQEGIEAFLAKRAPRFVDTSFE